MTHYRNSTQIVCDLLVATKDCGCEGINTTALLSRSNLNHGWMQTFLSTLTGSGLVNRIKFDGKNTARKFFAMTFDDDRVSCMTIDESSDYDFVDKQTSLADRITLERQLWRESLG